MGDLLFGTFIILFIGLGVSVLILGILINANAGKVAIAVTMILCGTVLGVLMHIPAQTVYYGTEAKLKYRDELRQIYNQELPKLDSNYDQIAKLNPDAAVLVNQDSPIATTMELRTDLIKRMTEAEREAVEALKTKYEIEQSLFSIFI